MNEKIIDCNKINETILKKLKQKIDSHQYTIACLYIKNNKPSLSYLKQIKKQATYLNVEVKEFEIENNEEKIINKIHILNKEKNNNGILFIHPGNKNLNYKKINRAIQNDKNIDSLLKSNTVLATLEILNFLNIKNIQKKKIVIIGRGQLVGYPLYIYLKEKGYNVMQCHSKTQNIQFITSNADILISAVGKPHIIKKEDIKKDAIIIDIGTSFVKNKLYGDVNLDDVLDKVKLITSTPNGVGPLTTTMLFKNLIEINQKTK